MALKDFTSSIPLVGSLFDDSADQALEQLRKNQELYGGIELPSFNEYTPEELQYLGDLLPEMAQYQTIQEDPATRSAQLSALAKMAGLAEGGLALEDQAAFARAEREASQQAQARRASALADAQTRGVAGSGLEFAMREMGSQDAANRQQQAGLEQAAQAARQRALYNQTYLQGMGDVRGQDLQANSANANIINRFNEMNTQNRNAAQERNLNTRQQIQQGNANLRNDAQKYRNELAQQNFGNQMTRANGMAGANTGMAQGYAAQNAARQSDRNANTDLAFKAIFGPGGGK